MTALRTAVAGVVDPELRVVTIEELGILRDVTVDGGHATVTVTPKLGERNPGVPAAADLVDLIVGGFKLGDISADTRAASVGSIRGANADSPSASHNKKKESWVLK